MGMGTTTYFGGVKWVLKLITILYLGGMYENTRKMNLNQMYACTYDKMEEKNMRGYIFQCRLHVLL